MGHSTIFIKINGWSISLFLDILCLKIGRHAIYEMSKELFTSPTWMGDMNNAFEKMSHADVTFSRILC